MALERIDEFLYYDEEKNVYYDTRFCLTELQQKIANDSSRYKLIRAGRRTGKSGLAVRYSSLKALSKPNQNIALISLTHQHAFNTLGHPLIQLQNPNDIERIKNVLPIEIQYTNGSRIVVAGGQHPEVFQGNAYDLVILDEVGDLSKKLFYQYIQPTLADRKGQCWLMGTKKGQGIDWVEEELSNQLDFKKFEMTTIEGGFVDDEEIERARRTLPDKIFKQEYLNELITLGGLIYDEFNDKNILNIEQHFDSKKETFLTFDFNINPSTGCILQRKIDDNDKFVVVHSWNLKDTNTERTCEYLENWFEKNSGKPRLLKITGDYSGNQRRSSSSTTDWGIIQKFFKNYGNVSYKVIPTKSKKGRYTILNSNFKRGIILINQNQKYLIKELQNLQYKEGTMDAKLTDNIQDHITDALSYFTMNYLPLEEKYSFISGY